MGISPSRLDETAWISREPKSILVVKFTFAQHLLKVSLKRQYSFWQSGSPQKSDYPVIYYAIFKHCFMLR